MSSAARTYARALMQAAGAQAATVADQLEAFAAIRTDAPEQWEALLAPSVPAAVRKATIRQLLADASELTRNALMVLVDHHRLAEVDEVAEAFRMLVREQERQLDVHVTSAIELTPELKAKLEEGLSSSTGRSVSLHTSVDPSIIGGLVVQHGHTLYDTSLRGRLESLRVVLSRAPQRGSATTESNDTDG